MPITKQKKTEQKNHTTQTGAFILNQDVYFQILLQIYHCLKNSICCRLSCSMYWLYVYKLSVSRNKAVKCCHNFCYLGMSHAYPPSTSLLIGQTYGLVLTADINITTDPKSFLALVHFYYLICWDFLKSFPCFVEPCPSIALTFNFCFITKWCGKRDRAEILVMLSHVF